MLHLQVENATTAFSVLGVYCQVPDSLSSKRISKRKDVNNDHHVVAYGCYPFFDTEVSGMETKGPPQLRRPFLFVEVEQPCQPLAF